ncbi:MAG: dihydroorotase family protein [Actinomycetota bacterium]
MFDLGIEGGTVVTPRGRRPSHVYLSQGRIGAITPTAQPAKARVAAGGCLVMPGMVDTHVHLMDPGATDREDFPAGTAAAAAAGVTTILEHTHAAPVRTPADLIQKREHLRRRSRIDFGLVAHAWPGDLDQVLPLWEAGAAGFKAFTCTTHGVPGFDAAALLGLLQRAAQAGAPCLVHCEDESITAAAEEALLRAGRNDPGVVPSWRNREAELTAVAGTVLLASRSGARVVVAHVSHAEALALVTQARRGGAHVIAETCPQYLTLFESEILEHGAFRKFTPPARARSGGDLEEMWRAVKDGRIHHISTDHAPSTTSQKNVSIWEAPFGLPGLDTTLPLLLDAAHSGAIGYEDVVRAYSEAPSRAYGLYPRKGSLLPGADADIVLVDPEAKWKVRDEDLWSRAGWSPYAGRVLTGGAVRTFLRGRLIAEGRKVLAEPGAGRFLPGPGAERSTAPTQP